MHKDFTITRCVHRVAFGLFLTSEPGGHHRQDPNPSNTPVALALEENKSGSIEKDQRKESNSRLHVEGVDLDCHTRTYNK